MKQKYRHTFRCPCGKTFKLISTNPDPQVASCPDCKKKEAWRRNIIGDGAVTGEESGLKEGIHTENPKEYYATARYSCSGCDSKLLFRMEKETDTMAHCYKCGSQNIKHIGYQVGWTSSAGSKDAIKAIDIVAEGAMKSYGMTDLNMNSNMRPGDNCAPKLPPHQQQAVDGFFNHGNNPALKGVNLNSIGKRAIAGAYRDPNNPVAMAHKARMRPSNEGKYVDATPGKK